MVLLNYIITRNSGNHSKFKHQTNLSMKAKKLLKEKLLENLGGNDSQLSDEDINKIIKTYESTPEKDRDKLKIQEILESALNIDPRIMRESIDNSDVDYVIDQLEEFLKQQKKDD